MEENLISKISRWCAILTVQVKLHTHNSYITMISLLQLLASYVDTVIMFFSRR